MKFFKSPFSDRFRREPSVIYSPSRKAVRLNTEFGAWEFNLDELVKEERVIAHRFINEAGVEQRHEELTAEILRLRGQIVDLLANCRGLQASVEADQKFRKRFKIKARELIKEVISRSKCGDTFDDLRTDLTTLTIHKLP